MSYGHGTGEHKLHAALSKQYPKEMTKQGFPLTTGRSTRPTQDQSRHEGDGTAPTDSTGQNRGAAADSPQLLSGAVEPQQLAGVESEEERRRQSAGNSMLTG
jgi:hypothetical protein